MSYGESDPDREEKRGIKVRGSEFVPGVDDVVASWSDAAEGFIVVELDLAVQLHCLRNAGPDEVVIILAAAVEGCVMMVAAAQ